MAHGLAGRGAMQSPPTLTDGIATLIPFWEQKTDELWAAVCESAEELKPWLSWAHEGYSLEDARAAMANARAAWEEGSAFSFAITDARTGEVTGGCGLSQIHRPNRFCNLGYWVRSSRRGEGLAGRAARLAARFAFEELGLVRVEVVIAEGNRASLRVAKKLGLRSEGVLRNRITAGGQAHDAYMFALVPEDFGRQAR